MSIRRKSCDPCYKGRRKCDLAYPICMRCQNTNKSCHYLYPPQLPSTATAQAAGAVSLRSRDTTLADAALDVERLQRTQDQYGSLTSFDFSEDVSLVVARPPTPSKYLGHLGELPPINAGSNPWLHHQIRSYPGSFAARNETIFLHRSMYEEALPPPLLAAFGICAGSLVLNERNQSALFQAVDVEMTRFLTPTPSGTLRDDLAKLQAAVLYQIIRLFYGGLEQRILAEGQEYPVRTFGLGLLLRAEAELRSAPQTWENWILAESIRRTVIVSFKLHTTYREGRYGLCSEFTAIAILPISAKPIFWKSRDTYISYQGEDETTNYEGLALQRASHAPNDLEPFERLLLLGCRPPDYVPRPASAVASAVVESVPLNG
ncbi:hypothetical protein GQ53DRAFT_740684 [Thozetella sp. PMI_491]|nr:hypothetical protein GQ53DRAFT_740684 [Thozetella sp. PMI_491]